MHAGLAVVSITGALPKPMAGFGAYGILYGSLTDGYIMSFCKAGPR
jgi:hypothetical protein